MAMLCSFSLLAQGQGERVFTLDPARGQVKWTGTKVTGKHWGTVKVKSGQMRLNGNQLTGGTVAIDMTSISVDDIKDPETNAKLVNHLKNDDFFAVDKHPTATLEMREVKARPGEASSFDVQGMLAIRGVSKPISFVAKVTPSGDTFEGSARLEWNRAEYGIKYKSGSFFKQLGDQLIHDKVTMEVALVATRQTSGSGGANSQSAQ